MWWVSVKLKLIWIVASCGKPAYHFSKSGNVKRRTFFMSSAVRARHASWDHSSWFETQIKGPL